MAYISVSELKGWLDITSGTEDTLLTRICAVAESFIDWQTGEKWLSASATKTFSSRDILGRSLHTGFVTSISSVLNGSEDVTSSCYLAGANGVTWRVVLRVDSGKTWINSLDPDISVTGYFGVYAVLPEWVKQVALELSQWMYAQRDLGVLTNVLVNTSAGAILQPSLLPPNLLSQIRGMRKAL